MIDGRDSRVRQWYAPVPIERDRGKSAGLPSRRRQDRSSPKDTTDPIF